jgi:glycosyltransferase involved in cell wall biosynthesis
MSAINSTPKKILFVVPYNPLLGSKGAQGPKNVTQPLITLLSSVHDIVLIVVTDDPTLKPAALRAKFPALREAHVCRSLSGRARRIARLRYLLRCLPPSLADGESSELPALLSKYASWSDLVHFEYFTLAPSIRLVQPRRPVQLHCHDAYSLFQKRYLEQANGIVKKAKALLRFLMFKHLEHSFIAKAAAALTVSPVDQGYLAHAGLTNVRYLPPPVQQIEQPIQVNRDAMPPELLCVVPASFEEFQAAALRDFFRDAYPSLIQKFPGQLPVTLLGKSARLMQAELQPYVQVQAVEFVDDYFAFLANRNWIYFYPQRAGAGLHTKVRDAMALRLPIVGYSEIMEAFQGTNWQHYVSCGDAAAVVEALASMLANPDLRRKLGDGGHRLLSERFSENSVLRTWEEVGKEIECYGN